ncbi:exonuclease RdgC [Solidesulfovibrio carbinoliphilus subsp. oakridgensis]|uniref:Exonuclease RdgC n=1 Tax=Solidesulfovibrio carbinoliphilus subsp. oakridgensis TaxID=694327 RepID=G7Q5K6_9BACT|nr:recombination-associated protein RdgC [Solidesulfovibrio carbinoliphilus]EHJ49565.1 exonuclease RdgC [Solidesulfovibrio carbinoliphilus subsp. oakridgensis]
MSFKRGTTALTVYQTTQAGQITGELLQRFALLSIDGTADERGQGLVPFDTPLDHASWPMAQNFAGQFALFCLRVDTRRIPAAVMKKHLAEAMSKEKEAMVADGKAFISKDRKREIKDRVKLQLLARTEPAPAIVEVAVDRTSGRVFFGSTAIKMKDTFEALWFAMTGERLVEQTPETILEDPYGVGHGVALLTAAYNGGLHLDNGMEIVVEKKATIRSATTTMAVTAVDLDNVGEAVKQLTAVEITKAKIGIEYDGNSFDLTVTPDLGMTGIKLPKTQPKAEEGDDPDALLLERLYLLGQVVDVLHRALRETVVAEEAA